MTPTTNPTPDHRHPEARTPWALEIDAGVHQINDANGHWLLECMPEAAPIILEAVNSHSTLTEETARLKERVRVLEERLEPFARMASDIHEAAPDSALCVVATLNGGIMSNKNFCTVGDLRRARSALHTTPEVGE